MSKRGITVAGSLIVDNYFLIDTYPEQGKLTNIRGTNMDIGGSGNLIVDLAKLDPVIPIKVSAIIGKDNYGAFIKKILSKYPNIIQDNITEQGNSCVTMVMDAQDNHQRTFFYLPEGSDRYDESYINWEMIDATIFHLEYLLLMKKVDASDPEYGTHGARILHNAKMRNMKTSIDIVSEVSQRGRDSVRAALKYTDYCTINEIEAEMITGLTLLENEKLIEDNMYKALYKLKKLGVSTWAIIHSPTCSYGLDCTTGKISRVKSLKLPKDYIKGSTGAGDAFCSGVLYTAYHDGDIEDAMKLGCACAACSLSEVSGTAGMRSYEEVRAVYKKYCEQE
ncbi:carbohydrate kinase family protein [Sporanaerobium hydrogeniformans]|uniref:Carbohydrate kinase family protein n=1 Tax=Sporanaerobium hydrogeniformans TaxID=3072179 RepID=A0AC61DBE5_9FIRM|nr:carbohydrate kinase family protein [Sporanaerobium hydrogeniformans]PHV70060.1 carbohydrate kinase family protein [Sporanaerobium hydrogeniformans]